MKRLVTGFHFGGLAQWQCFLLLKSIPATLLCIVISPGNKELGQCFYPNSKPCHPFTGI